MNEMSRFFKRTALDLRVPIILINQANETGERSAEAKGLERDSDYYYSVQKLEKGDQVLMQDAMGEYYYKAQKGDYLAKLKAIRYTEGNKNVILTFSNNRYLEKDTREANYD
ncbi:MAG: hypothetical protein D6707_12115 [Bacteroidetes bacterium]|nr:MAG: hypothetical protein D6707_12115 [Bacteroidota bacterium]